MKDVSKLYRALDKYRKENELSWRGLGRAIGVASCTFTRMKDGRGVNVENYLKIRSILEL